jgi:tetratricopeptide (TPR) repeat protein
MRWSVTSYVWKTIWPADLAPFYLFHAYPAGRRNRGVALALATGLAIAAWRKWPFVTVGWLWYVVMVAPVIGLMQAGEQARADRFMYVPLVGLLFIAAWGGAALLASMGIRTRAVAALAIAVVLASAVVAHAQASYWIDSVTLWRHAAAVTDANYVAYENLGQALRERGDLDGAIANYEQSLTLLPANSTGHESVIRNSLGLILERQGRPDAAERYFAEATQLNPRFAEAQNNLGNALAMQGQFDEAIAHFRAALAIQPQSTEALIGLGGALVREGRPDDAAVQYREALRLDPGMAQAHNGLGSALTLQHRDDEAMVEFTRALELKPDLPSAHLNIAIVLLRKGDTPGAQRHLETALQIDPGYQPARNVLARIR